MGDDETMEVKKVVIDNLKPAEYNPRSLTEKEYKDLKNSLERFGFVEPLVVNSAEERENIIIGGHQRWRVAKDMGYKEVPVYYIKISEWGQQLIDNRDMFVGKHCYHSFIGYAYGQLRKMTKLNFEGYMGVKRKKLVEKFGYDVKNAAHCIRILKMGIEFLIEGKLNVFRSDRQQLLAIKMGEWSLKQVKDEANKLFDLAKESYVKSTLPNEPNYERSNDLLINIIENYWKKNK